MKNKVILCCFLLLMGCSDKNLIKNISEEYVEFLSKEVETDFNVFVREIKFEDKNIYRFTSGTINLDYDEIPNLYYEYKGHYIFIFLKDSNSQYSKEDLKKEGLYNEKERIFSEEDYDEWLLIFCDKSRYKIIKDSWYRPLDSLDSVRLYKCN